MRDFKLFVSGMEKDLEVTFELSQAEIRIEYQRYKRQKFQKIALGGELLFQSKRKILAFFLLMVIH